LNFAISKIALAIGLAILPWTSASAELALAPAPGPEDLVLWDGRNVASLLEEPTDEPAVLRATHDLAADFLRVTGVRPEIENQFAADKRIRVIIGTLGRSKLVDRLAEKGKLATNGVGGQWESYVLQIVKSPLPGAEAALVIAGSDTRGTIYGLYQLSELIGVSPWYWWADVPVKPRKSLALRGGMLKQGPPAVKYRGIFLNDEDFGLRPWAAKMFDPDTGNIGPKTYAKVFELLLRLRANYLWPAMHPGTAAFNSFPKNRELADAYGIVMGSSHCEQMLRNNVSEWDEKQFGDYNFAANPGGVLKYWEQRVRENAHYENIFTLGMRGIHDGGMPGGGTAQEQAARLQEIIRDQRKMLASLIDTNVARVPQLFCPYKEALDLYRLAPEIPDDITLLWPDDNYGYIREFSNARERARAGGAGVYYHVSYWGRPRDYLWLCSTPPALIAEEMTKAYDYGANKVWILNVGDLKPAELDVEFFLKLAWRPHTWHGTNTYGLLERQFARDFGESNAPEITTIMAEHYRLNFQRKPEHMGFPSNNLFSDEEAAQRLAQWKRLSERVDAVADNLPANAQDALFELVGYPVKAAAAMNEKCLAGSPPAQDEIHRLTVLYNNRTAGGKWRHIMSDNPRGQLDFRLSKEPLAKAVIATNLDVPRSPESDFHGAAFTERNRLVVMEAEHASRFIAGKDAHWVRIEGLGYNGEAVSVYPTTVAVRASPAKIQAESPCLEFRIYFNTPGDWKFSVRALPTFSIETGQPQRYAIALDTAPPKIISLPAPSSENDPQWQEDVLRNAALTTSVLAVSTPGLHTLKLWMVDPGVVVDTIAAQNGTTQALGYVWPAEESAW
jgi:hypothetical protein